jgi:hypothetical protein
MSHCHCSICRKSHGSAFATFAAGSVAGFRWVRGEKGLARYEASPGFLRSFCRRCGSTVAGAPSGDRVFMPAGCFHGDPGGRPLAHIFVASKAPWVEICDELPRFDAYPPGFEAPSVPPRPELESAAGALRGSCLCGEVIYRIEGEPRLVRNCHCSRCRRGRAAAYASNLLAEAEDVRFTRGEDLLASFKVPEAARFTQVFCRRCGSILPRIDRDLGIAVVPLGSLDDDPGLRPQCHIFVTSKAPWVEIADALPQHEEYPPGAA